MARRSLIALAVTAFLAVFAAPAAFADTGDIIEQQHDPPTEEDGFQAGTCFFNKEPDPPGKFCSPETPEIFFEEAGGHPPIGFTQYIVKHILPEPANPARQIPVGSLNEIRVDLPAGLTVNPQATDQCELAVFEANETLCPPGSIVGKEELTLATVVELNPNPFPFGPSPLPSGSQIPPNPILNTEPPLYNLVPEQGEPARFGFKIGPTKAPVFLRGTVDWAGDYHQGFFIKIPPSSSPALRSLKSRLVNNGRSGDGTYITNPTTCLDPNSGAYSTFLRAQAVGDTTPNFPAGYTPWEAALPPGTGQKGCESIPFEPSLQVQPGTTQADSPAAPEVTVSLPFKPDPEGREQSHVRNASVTLPAGMGLNPSAAPALQACTTEQFGKGTENPVACPPGSKIGTAEVETQPLPAGSLKGDVYLGQQIGSNPESGEMYRIFINPKSERFDVDVRLIGNVIANRETGQLTARLLETPQVPFESVKLKFDQGKGLLTSPPTCAKQGSSTTQEPWARPGTSVTATSEFTLSGTPAGGPCPQTLAERKFTPGYLAKSDSAKAGAYSPFRVRIARVDGEQELKVVDVTLPKGLTGKLAGIPYCSEAAIAAAAASTGAAELANSSCSSSSQIGTTSTDTGTGAKPLNIGGKAYLAGPYKGAPLSMVVVTPAVAGPFDLGTVVVRVALNVNPSTAQINAVSDVIPDVFGGAKLDIRLIDVNVDRPQFMKNPTNCAAQATSGVINGGGAGQAPFSVYNVSAPYQATECNKLAFKPKLFTRLFGPTKRAKNPRIRAILEARNNDANMARAALTLPPSLFLDQSHIKTICTRPQLASMTCPKGAVYGNAKAKSPLLDRVLKGPVYLVASNDKLPNLVADLRGQVRIQLRGVISSKRGGLKTVFPEVPDVPVKKFILNMRGGKKSLIVNSRNLCEKKQKAVLNLKGQNGKKLKNNKYKLRISNCGKKK